MHNMIIILQIFNFFLYFIDGECMIEVIKINNVHLMVPL